MKNDKCSMINAQCRQYRVAWTGSLLLLFSLLTPLRVQKACAASLPALPRETVQQLIHQTVTNAVRQFADQALKAEEVAVTVIDLNAPAPAPVSFRGDVQIYPASVIKLFYLVAVHRWLEDGRLEDSDELERAMKDMIVDSSNDATHYLVDVLTGTTSGPELDRPALEEWFQKRNAVNRYFASLGYTNINANKKPWCEGPYGREMQAIRLFTPKRNALTTDATARLLSEIASGKAVQPSRSRQMLNLLKRDPSKTSTEPDDQSRGFIGGAVPPGASLWSKAGWTSETRHDAAYLEFPNGARIVLVIFTVNHGNERRIVPEVARPIIEAFSALPAAN